MRNGCNDIIGDNNGNIYFDVSTSKSAQCRRLVEKFQENYANMTDANEEIRKLFEKRKQTNPTNLLLLNNLDVNLDNLSATVDQCYKIYTELSHKLAVIGFDTRELINSTKN